MMRGANSSHVSGEVAGKSPQAEPIKLMSRIAPAADGDHG